MHPISWKIRPVGAELFHADTPTDGQTDTTELRERLKYPP